MKVRTILLRAAGTNCDFETEHAFQLAGSETELVHINRLKRKERNLEDYHILVIPGGFTYGDDIAAGKILANELKYNLQESTQQFRDDGKLILGICNGFQVLVKADLLAVGGGGEGSQTMTLTFNDSAKFEDRWVYLKAVQKNTCVFTQGLEDLMYIPVAHAEGKFVTRNAEAKKRLWENNQVVFQYVNSQGELADYPWNPNGSMDSIAGICDPTGRIFGLMPHPERHINPTNHPRWTRGTQANEGQGLTIFQSAVDFVIHHL
jgi:phosphoribosylformylglycinamidine synthase I